MGLRDASASKKELTAKIDFHRHRSGSPTARTPHLDIIVNTNVTMNISIVFIDIDIGWI